MDNLLPLIVGLAAFVLMIASMWVLFIKANEPGWAALIPIYNWIVVLKVAGKPLWWIGLLFVPGVNLVVYVLVNLSVARSFGKDAGFGVGLIFFPIIFRPLLAFGDAKYQGPAG